MSPPSAPNDPRTIPAATAARDAVRRRCSWLSAIVMARNIGTAAGASTTSSSVVSVDSEKATTFDSTPPA